MDGGGGGGGGGGGPKVTPHSSCRRCGLVIPVGARRFRPGSSAQRPISASVGWLGTGKRNAILRGKPRSGETAWRGRSRYAEGGDAHDWPPGLSSSPPISRYRSLLAAAIPERPVGAAPRIAASPLPNGRATPPAAAIYTGRFPGSLGFDSPQKSRNIPIFKEGRAIGADL